MSRETTISIQGMTCQSCVNAVTKALTPLVEKVTVDLNNKSATIYSDQPIGILIEAIEDCGFTTSLPLSKDSENNERLMGSSTAQLHIGGMTCASCVSSIERGLEKITGINSVQVSLLAESANVQYTENLVTASQIAEAIYDMGFEASLVSDTVTLDENSKLQLQIYGMTCSSCVHAIESGIKKLEGVSTVSVNLMTELATVHHDPSIIGAREIVEAIQGLGFDALVSDKSRKVQIESLSKVREILQWRRLFLTSLVFSLPVFFIAMIFPQFQFDWLKARVFPGLFLFDLIQLLLTIPVQFYIARPFLKSAYQSLKHGAPTMDVLVSLSTLSAFTFSILSMARSIWTAAEESPTVFFDTSSSLISFILLGRYLENMAKGQSSTALSKLMSLSPSTALLVEYGQDNTVISEKSIPSELIQIGDHLKITPGAKIPTDGLVIYGQSSVDESMVTGESEPVNKSTGQTVIGGTLNGLSTFTMKATRVGADTALSQIVKLVEDAQVGKAPIQGFTDRVASVFVPGVLALGALTLTIWSLLVSCLGIEQMPALLQHEITSEANGDWFFVCLKMCISVVIVACPCALGLATPTAVMVGTGLAAQHGVIFKSGAVLESGQKVNKIVFDKTGTLTTGNVEVVNYKSWDGLQDQKMLLLAGIAETQSEHLLGRAVVNKVRETQGLSNDASLDFLGSVMDFKSMTGFGIECFVVIQDKKTKVVIGNQQWLENHHILVTDSQIDTIKTEASQGFTSIWVALDDQSVGYISVSDIIKPEAELVIQRLSSMGIEIAMVTGDNSITANYIAQKVGITQVHAGISPGGKTDIVQAMQSELRLQPRFFPLSPTYIPTVVAMVGDGINDSPALVASDLGIALCSGTDIAMEAADVVLMRSNLTDVVVALDLSRCIFRRIKLNLGWACVYNMIGIPLAMGILIPFGIHIHPMMAGMAMAASSTSVVLSSLMLKWRWQKPTLNDPPKRTRNFFQTWFQRKHKYQPLQDYDLESLSPQAS